MFCPVDRIGRRPPSLTPRPCLRAGPGQGTPFLRHTNSLPAQRAAPASASRKITEIPPLCGTVPLPVCSTGLALVLASFFCRRTVIGLRPPVDAPGQDIGSGRSREILPMVTIRQFQRNFTNGNNRRLFPLVKSLSSGPTRCPARSVACCPLSIADLAVADSPLFARRHPAGPRSAGRFSEVRTNGPAARGSVSRKAFFKAS